MTFVIISKSFVHKEYSSIYCAPTAQFHGVLMETRHTSLD